MQTNNDKQLQELINTIITNIKLKNNNIILYLISLLFAIGLNIYWLIYVFSILLFISLLIYFNRRFHFVQFKKIK